MKRLERRIETKHEWLEAKVRKLHRNADKLSELLHGINITTLIARRAPDADIAGLLRRERVLTDASSDIDIMDMRLRHLILLARTAREKRGK